MRFRRHAVLEVKRADWRIDSLGLLGGGHSVFEEIPEESNGIMPEWLGRNSLYSPRDLPRAASVARKTRGAAVMRGLSPGN